jgi:hypothetical protein
MKPLKIIKNKLYYKFDGEKIDGPNGSMTGDCSGLSGDCTWLRGDLDEIPMKDRELKPNLPDWVEG